MSFMHVESASVKPPRIFGPLLGLGIVLAADGATALIFHTTVQRGSGDLSILSLAVPVVALLVGRTVWFSFIVTPRCVTIRRGLLVGIDGSIIAQPVVCMSLCLPALFMPEPVTPLSLSYLLLIIVFSLIYGGWATPSIGVLAGVLLIALQRPLMCAQQRFSREAEVIQWSEMSNADALQARSDVKDVNP